MGGCNDKGSCRIELPSVKDVLDCCDLTCDQFRLAACEADLMKQVAEEQITGGGTPVAYYRLDKNASSWNPLYNEPEKLVFKAPLNLTARVQKPEKNTQANEKGQTTTWDAVVWIAVASWPSTGDPPTEGDVVGFWDSAYFRGAGVRQEKIPGASFYYDVIGVDTDGHVNDTSAFVAWEVTLKRRTEFTPERRLHELVP